ncbi:MAG: PQQ-dependent sugar dehydrogenase [Planctomycetota bacterium]
MFLHALATIAAAAHIALAAPPAGFTSEPMGAGWSEACGVAFVPQGEAIVFERGGRLWTVNAAGVKSAAPLLDLSDEVGGWRDYGLLSVAVHPNFAENGWIYLLYVVDRHHLDFAGTAQYSATTSTYFAATIGRIARYELHRAKGALHADLASRTVLLGETASTGVPIVHQSHGLGTLAFAEDGTLLVTTGDAASYNLVDAGGQVADGYVNDGLARGILRAKENIGAFRSQLVDCLNGKILRLDPVTGDGVPSNPWFDAAAPRAPRSRVWALGLRNPFRMSVLPGSGGHDPSEGNPGTIYIGDVGWSSWEDLHACTAARQNFGWPLFEGHEHHTGYWNAAPANPDAPTGQPAPCPANHGFRDLLGQDSQDAGALSRLDPCRFLQAESAAATGAPVASTYVGYQGAGYRDYQQTTGEKITFSTTVPATGQYTLHVRYAHGGTSNRPLRVEVDGASVVPSLAFNPTGAWTEWRLQSTPLTLAAGTRQIALASTNASGPNIDGVALVAGSGAAPVIAPSVPTFVHRRPLLDWSHGGAVARTPSFANGAASVVNVGVAGGATGTPFAGLCAVGGPIVDNAGWPADFRNVLFVGDYASGWIRALALGSGGSVSAVRVFDASAPAVVALAANPNDGSLWSIRWPGTVLRHRYQPGANQPPVARIAATPPFGASPLSVTLSAAGSTDPENGALSFVWNFGDGTPNATGATVTHVYAAPSAAPARFDPTVTVTDAAGASSTATLVIGVNNTPPAVAITSLYDGMLYPIDSETAFPLRAAVSDAEHAAPLLSCKWVTTLHHNTHTHSEPPDPLCETTTLISPLGCGLETYFFEVALTVTDAGGLAATDSVFLYPDCNGWLACPADLDHNGSVDAADMAALLSQWSMPGPTDLDRDGTTAASDLAALLNAWGACGSPR